MYCFDAMRALAILLVTHSHMEGFYPVRAVATGGLLGNTLFFMVSGMLISRTLADRRESFAAWYLRRLKRLYLPLWLLTGLLFLLGVPMSQTPAAMLERLVVPDDYWFLPAIAVFYPACFLLAGPASRRLCAIAIAASVTAYLVLYILFVDLDHWDAENHVLIKCFYYFAVMLAGLRRSPPAADHASRPPLLPLAAFTAAFFLFLLLLKLTGAYSLQVGAQLLAFVWATCVANVFCHPVSSAWIERRFGSAIPALATLSLPIYLVQVPLLRVGWLQTLPLPLSVAAFLAPLLGLAWLLQRSIALATGPAHRSRRTG